MRPESGLIKISSGHLVDSYNKSERLLVYAMHFELTLNFIILTQLSD